MSSLVKKFNPFEATKKEVPEDIDMGEIYMLYNLESGKRYVGQALCYVSNRVPWGAKGRWKSHIREAYGNNGGNKKDRCTVLNSAIRKYKPDSFILFELVKCKRSDLDMYEKQYIEDFKTMIPNGYNIKEGGSSCKPSEESRRKQSEARLGKKFSENAKLNISRGQFGNRRGRIKSKKYDNSDLPDHMYRAYGNDKKTVIGYKISRYPVGVDKAEYISKQFTNKNDITSAYNDAIKYLEELKNKYAHIHKEIEENNKKYLEEKAKLIEGEKKKRAKDKLPEYIYPLYKDDKQIGVYIEGYKKYDGTTFPRLEFTSAQSISRNIVLAENCIEQMRIYNADKTYSIPKLPQKLVRSKNPNGFKIINMQVGKTDKTINKKFVNNTETMEEKYNKAIAYYDSIKNGIIPKESEKREPYFRFKYNFDTI